MSPVAAFEFAAPLWRYPGEGGWYKAGTYLLPLKKAVRTAECLEPGDTIRAMVEVVDR